MNAFYESNTVKEEMTNLHELIRFLLKDVILQQFQYIYKRNKFELHSASIEQKKK